MLAVLKDRKQSQDRGPLNLKGAGLGGLDLANSTVLQGANLQGADLWNADLTRANLQGADLRRAYFGGADLREAILRGADLRGADLLGTRANPPQLARNLTREQLVVAIGDDRTLLPDEDLRPAQWSNPPMLQPAARRGLWRRLFGK